MEIRKTENVLSGGCQFLGIEFGSTRIKAVLIDDHHKVIAQGNHDWENQMENGIWTYSLDAVINGLQSCYQQLKKDYYSQYGKCLHHLDGMGISAMMHGYLVFDAKGALLTPFRTWRNTMTLQASRELSDLFQFHIPQRWSIAHLYQAILNKEAHVSDIALQTTLAGYVHYLLTGNNVLGIGEASGMFPIDTEAKDYDAHMLELFDKAIENPAYPWKLREILPKVLLAGEDAGILSEEGAKLLDPTGDLKPGVPLCPPEGDAQTGMVATNSIQPRSGNVSAGTSVFAMVVLEEPLKKMYEEIDVVTTPEGNPVAMVHCNNGTSELNAWIGIFQEVLQLAGKTVNKNDLYQLLFHKALEADAAAGGLLACNYLSGEHITGFAKGFPLFVRSADSTFDLANFMLTQLYASLATLKIGMDILTQQEHVQLDHMYGHGGLFKTPEVGQKIMAAAMHAPISVMTTAGEGGAWGSAVLAAYRVNRNKYSSLLDYLERNVFSQTQNCTIRASEELQEGFDSYIASYKKELFVERAAIRYLGSDSSAGQQEE